MWRWEDVREGVKMSRCEDEQMWEKMWTWADVKMSRCERRCERRCEDEQMWEKMCRWADVKMSRCERRSEDEQMWEKMWEKMWRWADVREDVDMSRCEDEQMWEKIWRWADVKVSRCERRCEDEQMWEKMWRWADVREDVKMRRCFTDPNYWKNPALRRSREKWPWKIHKKLRAWQVFGPICSWSGSSLGHQDAPMWRSLGNWLEMVGECSANVVKKKYIYIYVCISLSHCFMDFFNPVLINMSAGEIKCRLIMLNLQWLHSISELRSIVAEVNVKSPMFSAPNRSHLSAVEGWGTPKAAPKLGNRPWDHGTTLNHIRFLFKARIPWFPLSYVLRIGSASFHMGMGQTVKCWRKEQLIGNTWKYLPRLADAPTSLNNVKQSSLISILKKSFSTYWNCLSTGEPMATWPRCPAHIPWSSPNFHALSATWGAECRAPKRSKKCLKNDVFISWILGFLWFSLQPAKPWNTTEIHWV